MKIHCTSGCICTCLTIDKVDINDIDSNTRKEALEKIKDYILKQGFSEDYMLSGFLGHIYGENTVTEKYDITENETTCEFLVFGKEPKNLTEEECRDIVKDAFDSSFLDDSIFWWFMEDYIGLDYQYTCEECWDSVYSKTINI